MNTNDTDKKIINAHTSPWLFRCGVFKIHNSKFNIQNKGGFVLLVAVLVSTLLLSLGVAILNSTVKELRLSSLGRDSQFAFYAADSGNECALFWDIRGNVFPTSTDSSIPSSGVTCVSSPTDDPLQDIAQSWAVTRNSNSAKTTFNLTFPPQNYCATVVVSKADVSGDIRTTIESRGYNTCDVTNKRRVERAIRTVYE